MNHQQAQDYYDEFIADDRTSFFHKVAMMSARDAGHDALVKCIDKMEAIYNRPMTSKEIHELV